MSDSTVSALRVPPTEARQIRHQISATAAFVLATKESLFGKNKNLNDADEFCNLTLEKLGALIRNLDAFEIENSKDLKKSDCTKTNEDIYTDVHPEIVKWTEFFYNRMKAKSIFQAMDKNHSAASQRKASIVGASWHRFSEFMPRFLCQAAAMVSTNEMRHYVIQTAFEELGMRRADEIHPDMFWRMAKLAGASECVQINIDEAGSIQSVLGGLFETLCAFSTDSEILGILLGLEIPAVENIEMIFSSLAHNDEIKKMLETEKFFILHRKIEPEHVRLTVSNFLRFCSDANSQHLFIQGFDLGLAFWKNYWDSIALTIEGEKIHA